MKSERDMYFANFSEKKGQADNLEKQLKSAEERTKKLQEDYFELRTANRVLKDRIHHLEIINDWNNGKSDWQTFFSAYGTVQIKDNDIILALRESIWTKYDSTVINTGGVDLVPLAQKLGGADYLEVKIYTYAVSSGETTTAIDLANARAAKLREQFLQYGVAENRIDYELINQKMPISKKKPVVESIANRIEIHLKLKSSP